MPATLVNNNAPSRDVIVPAPILSLPGLALARAISSLTVVRSVAAHHQSDMFFASSVTGAKSLAAS